MTFRLATLAALLALAAGPALAHDHYTGLRSPTGVSCCDDRDCRPVSLCTPASGGEGLVLDGRCEPLPYDKVIDAPGLDGVHACWRPAPPGGVPIVFCAMLGAGS